MTRTRPTNLPILVLVAALPLVVLLTGRHITDLSDPLYVIGHSFSLPTLGFLAALTLLTSALTPLLQLPPGEVRPGPLLSIGFWLAYLFVLFTEGAGQFDFYSAGARAGYEMAVWMLVLSAMLIRVSR